jgi:hypothetical protein
MSENNRQESSTKKYEKEKAILIKEITLEQTKQKLIILGMVIISILPCLICTVAFWIAFFLREQ